MAASSAHATSLHGSCDMLQVKLSALPNTLIDQATYIKAGGLTVGGRDIAAHCLVTGRMNRRTGVDGETYAIGFEMRLPQEWNGRFYYQANGGLDGNVLTATGGLGGGPVTNALDQGFAVLSSDAGHTGAQNPSFGIDPQARLDYGYQAAATLTSMAKSALKIAYGVRPAHSYFGGCSNGGRHTFVAMNRLANEYDGFLAGAPGYRLPLAAIASIYGAQQYAKVATDPGDLSTAFTAAERALVSQKVLDRCDKLDGLEDDIIGDFPRCQRTFSIKRDVPTCTDTRDGSCLSLAQKQAIEPIFKGPVTSNGKPVYAPFPYDSGLGTTGVASWEFESPLTRDSAAVGIVFGVPPENPATFDGTAFTLNASIDNLLRRVNRTDSVYTQSAMSFMTPPAPTDLSELKERGAKVMVYHGVSDAIFSVEDTAAWYEELQKANHGKADRFVRFFPVPGMGHCSGGPATDQFDMLTPLVNWVEKGKAPDRVIAQARGAGNPGGENSDLPADWSPTRTRPLCPYPQVATYIGKGNPESASSFFCTSRSR
ncbi:feruloyl esterase [Pseudomonas duriflava]|uniref:Feruloyl esterase n=1 Tax=Pseudomonas duriflava TaxID=459528 RepID=A0A562Q7H4_9PSED|nr:tannase/feruloyl esterase family alpha/beta hydrolase [Pseudomonas duriflava]TWI52712.1 feruloyl esterase [Pseudomonas duriflava]